MAQLCGVFRQEAVWLSHGFILYHRKVRPVIQKGSARLLSLRGTPLAKTEAEHRPQHSVGWFTKFIVFAEEANACGGKELCC